MARSGEVSFRSRVLLFTLLTSVFSRISCQKETSNAQHSYALSQENCLRYTDSSQKIYHWTLVNSKEQNSRRLQNEESAGDKDDFISARTSEEYKRFPYIVAASPAGVLDSSDGQNKIKVGEQMTVVFAQAVEEGGGGTQPCSQTVREDASELLDKFLSANRTVQALSALSAQFSLLARVLVLGKQFGTDRNDGEPKYAFFHVVKMAHIQIEQIEPHRNSGKIRLFWFKWTPPVAAHYELRLHIDLADCKGPIRDLREKPSQYCSRIFSPVLNLTVSALYTEGRGGSSSSSNSKVCDMSRFDPTDSHWMYSPRGPRPNSLEEVWNNPRPPKWSSPACPSFYERLDSIRKMLKSGTKGEDIFSVNSGAVLSAISNNSSSIDNSNGFLGKWVGDLCIVGDSNSRRVCSLVNEAKGVSEESVANAPRPFAASHLGTGLCLLAEQVMKEPSASSSGKGRKLATEPFPVPYLSEYDSQLRACLGYPFLTQAAASLPPSPSSSSSPGLIIEAASVLAVGHHTLRTSGEELRTALGKLFDHIAASVPRESILLVLPSLTTDPSMLSAAIAAVKGVASAEEIMLKASPYYQLEQNQILREAVHQKLPGWKYIDLATPSMMIDDIAHSDMEGAHYGKAKWFYDFVYEAILVQIHCLVKNDCDSKTA